jgi:hypothetical protein
VSIAKTLASRSLLFLADMSFVSPFVYSYFEQLETLEAAASKIDSTFSTGGYKTPHSTGVQSILGITRSILALLLAVACVSFHNKYIAPLTFSDTALQFLVHLPAVALAYYAFKRT